MDGLADLSAELPRHLGTRLKGESRRRQTPEGRVSIPLPSFLGIETGGWVGALGLHALVAIGTVLAVWAAAPLEPWPEGAPTFRVIFETPAPPSAPPAAIPEPMVPPPPAIPVTPEPPLVSAAPDEAPPPPPAKPVLRQSRPRPATAPVMPPAAAATTPADTQLAAAATLMPAPPSAPPSEAAYLPPRPMSAGDPGYPAEARQRGWQGRVVLRLEVSAEGAVSSVSVKSSSGHGILDNAALAKARTWRFIPAKRGGDAVTASVDWPIVFRLED